MRVKNTENSFSISEIPIDSHDINDRQNYLQGREVIEEEKHPRPKSSHHIKGEGRAAFRGQITSLNKTKREAYKKDGIQML